MFRFGKRRQRGHGQVSDLASLLVVDTLVVNTQSSQCRIELCQGDITQLDIRDKVDVICVSVSGKSYSPITHTLVGALSNKLKLSIKDLAEDKEEDLRHAYMCWWSKPLPEHLPFRKLLCFENTGRMFRPQELVANVFRCLVPILNNEPGTVITPLLNTGGQGCDEPTMLKGMVEAAIKWMKAGLPLKKLKIVLYAKVVERKVIFAYSRQTEMIFKAFRELKEKHRKEIMIPLAVPLEYDIYLSHCSQDAEVASMVEAKLQASKPGIRIYKSKPSSDEETQEEDEGVEGSVWKEDLYKIMSSCARVVPILSPAFLESKECVDLYNMALCCNRRAQRDLLAPLYIERIMDMPTYMGLVQYIDCSPKDKAKIGKGCEELVQSLDHSSMKVHMEMVMADASPLHYDVFVSYSHLDSDQAVPIVEKMQKLNPKLRIFFDIQELKAGTAWQKMLYHAVDGCRSFVALVSNSYMKSAMCIEEFNLALANHCSMESSLRLIPVCIEPLVDPLPEFQGVKLIDATPGVFDQAVEIICTSLVDWIAGRNWHPKMELVFTRKKRMIVDLAEYAIERRRLQFILQHGRGGKNSERDISSLEGLYCPSAKTTKMSRDNSTCDVAFSCAPGDKKFVAYMTQILREASPGLVIRETADTENERLALMESARKVVVFLSTSYLESVEQIEEFHTVLLRQRYRSPTQVLFPIIIHNLPQLPTYFHLVPCEYNLFDPMWMEIDRGYMNVRDLKSVNRIMHAGRELDQCESIGIMDATYTLLQQLRFESEHKPPPKTRQQPMLLNVLLLKAEVTRLHNKVQASGDKQEGSINERSTDGCSDGDIGDGSPNDLLLHIVESPPHSSGAARSRGDLDTAKGPPLPETSSGKTGSADEVVKDSAAEPGHIQIHGQAQAQEQSQDQAQDQGKAYSKQQMLQHIPPFHLDNDQENGNNSSANKPLIPTPQVNSETNEDLTLTESRPEKNEAHQDLSSKDQMAARSLFLETKEVQPTNTESRFSASVEKAGIRTEGNSASSPASAQSKATLEGLEAPSLENPGGQSTGSGIHKISESAPCSVLQHSDEGSPVNRALLQHQQQNPAKQSEESSPSSSGKKRSSCNIL